MARAIAVIATIWLLVFAEGDKADVAEPAAPAKYVNIESGSLGTHIPSGTLQVLAQPPTSRRSASG